MITQENTENETEEEKCALCNNEVTRREHALLCDTCSKWSHQRCMGMPPDEYRNLNASDENWYCRNCRTGPPELPQHQERHQQEQLNLKWGNMSGMVNIRNAVELAYLEIVTWQKNVIDVPRGKVGKDFIVEVTRLVKLFNNKTQWEPLAIHFLNIFVPIMLQKPSRNSKNKDHNRYLAKRLNLWKEGKLHELLLECKEIQKRISSSKQKEESNTKGFTRLMLMGKVKQALKLIDANNDIAGVHEINEEIRELLQVKHPQGEPAQEQILVQAEDERVEEVIFEEINADRVKNAARNTSGSGGPTKVDADIWKHILCSKSYGHLSDQLAEEIAAFGKRLCIDNIQHDYINSFLACRLVPLMKEDNGVRPVGIGEVLRRIIGKCVTQVLREDIQKASGSLQTCAGIESGIEAAIHAMHKTFNEDWCEAVLLVDADNAFNRLNREAALQNIKVTCPPLHTYLNNSYNTPAKLYMKDGSHILSEEGVTQGDNLSMAMYAISIRPLIDSLKESAGTENLRQVWYADDSTGAGALEQLKIWWEHLKENGPSYGYYPKPTKTHLILKNEDHRERAEYIFGGDGVNITSEGQRHIGAVLGSDNFRQEFINHKVEAWTRDVLELAKIAKEEPQAALSAYNTGLSQRWKFVQRTVKNIGDLFAPIEQAIRDKLIPAICGRTVSELDRKIMALPYRYGGLGIQNPTQTADREYRSSFAITSGLTELICQQEMDVTLFDKEEMKRTKLELKQLKENELKQEVAHSLAQLSDSAKRSIILAQEKGASAWLSALPIKGLGYALNKQEFRDAICLRYGWEISDTPTYCACGTRNSIDHILTCKKGGYVSMRHNAIRDAEAKLMREVCKDVNIEPNLIPTEGDRDIQGNIAAGARLDISARGMWSPCEKTFFDVRITHPNTESNRTKSIAQIYKQHESEKKRMYNDRVLNVERASFTPLVFTTSGGMGPECERLNKRLAEMIAAKRKETYSDVMRHVRTILRFAMLRSILVAIRGIRGKISEDESNLHDVSFNLIPRVPCYEAY